jgi:hypothetical protein
LTGVKWERWKKAEGEKRESAGAGRLWRDKSGNGEFLPRKGSLVPNFEIQA